MAKAKKKGHITMKVYDDYNVHFVIDWLAAGLAAGLEDNRLSTLVVTAAQVLLAAHTERKEKKAKKKAVKK
jgi:hypothetical protein